MTFIPIGPVSEELILVENFVAHDCVEFHHFNTRSLTFRNFHTRISTQLSRTYVQHTIRNTRIFQTARNGKINRLKILTNAHYTQQFMIRTRFSITNSLSRSIFRTIGHQEDIFRFWQQLSLSKALSETVLCCSERKTNIVFGFYVENGVDTDCSDELGVIFREIHRYRSLRRISPFFILTTELPEIFLWTKKNHSS